MSVWPGLGRLLQILSGVLAVPLQSALAEPLSHITPEAAYAEIARSAELRSVQIDGDFDVAKMQQPPGAKRFIMREVQLDGTLHSTAGGPALPLWIDRSHFRNVDLRGTRWSAALEIENSGVVDRAWFDSAQFDGAFTLHGSTLTGQSLFRGARFDGPVAITYSQFQPPPPLRSSVSFTDARFAAPARFDHSSFGTGVRFDTSRFEADASFLGLQVTGQASWRNVIFGGDAEFRFCRLGDADFGDIQQMSVFKHLADFRGCTMRSLRLDFVDARGDMLLVNLQIAPGELTLKQASLRGARNDFSGLKVTDKLDLESAEIRNLQMQWSEISPALLRAAPTSDVLRPLQLRLEELKKDDEAREASAVLRDKLIQEELAQPEASVADKTLLWVERIVWGAATGYGTRLGRVVGVALVCWVLLTLPLLFAHRMRIGALPATPDEAPPLHEAMAPDALQPPPASIASRGLQKFAYAFGLMFTLPDLRLRPAEPISAGWRAYLLFLRGVGVGLLALMALTLAKVSPVIQAVLGKIVG
jgi:uncharacterized protein YjbI with pentapeptide repeats